MTRQFAFGALPPPGREWEIGKTVEEIHALHTVINKTTLYVVCDANGECKGIFLTSEMAHKAASFYGAYVSENVIQNLLPEEVTKGE